METTVTMGFLLSAHPVYCIVCTKATGVHLFSVLAHETVFKTIVAFFIPLRVRTISCHMDACFVEQKSI